MYYTYRVIKQIINYEVKTGQKAKELIIGETIFKNMVEETKTFECNEVTVASNMFQGLPIKVDTITKNIIWVV